MLIPRNFARRSTIAGRGAFGFDRKNSESRESDVKEDLSRRLKDVCSHLSRTDFDTLVGDMTREQLRGEKIPGRKAGPC